MPNGANKNKIIIPQAASTLEQFKFEIANELGYGYQIGQTQLTPQNYQPVLNKMKYEIAGELGLISKINNGYWGELTSRECGAVGGRIGGKIGGNMVRQMIQYAEQNMLR